YRRVVTLNNNTTTAYTDVTPTSAIAGQPTPPAGSTQTAIPLVDIPRGPSGVTQRTVYRQSGGPWRKVETIFNNTQTTYTDTTPTVSLGGAPPTVNMSGPARVTVNNLPIGGPDVTARKLYRSAANTAA